MDFVTNWVTDKVAEYATIGVKVGGSLAGNAVGGVGTLVENSGRAVGQSANGIAGAIGSVGSYINNYGQEVQNSMAADGPVNSGAPKKPAVKATSATSAPRALPAAPGAVRSLPSTAARALPKSSSTSALPPPTKPPPSVSRNIPSRKPIPAQPAAKGYPSRRPPISTSQSARTADGRIKISPGSRSKPAKATAAGPNRRKRFDNSKRPTISTSQSERTADGKVKISAASRPRPVKA